MRRSIIIFPSLVLCLVAHITEPRSDERPSADQVVVILAPAVQTYSPDEYDNLSKVIQFQLIDLGLQVNLERVSRARLASDTWEEIARLEISENNALAVAWLKPNQDRWRFYLLMISNKNKWLMSREVDSPKLRTTSEALAVIVRASITALLIDKTTPSKQQPLPRKNNDNNNPNHPATSPSIDAPKPTTKPTDVSNLDQHAERPLWSLSMGYTLGITAKEVSPSQGVSMMVGLQIIGPLKLIGGYFFMGTDHHEDSGVHLKIRRHPIVLGIKAEQQQRSRLGWDFTLGLIVDYVTQSITITDANIAPSSAGGHVQIALLSMAGLSIKVSGEFRLFAAAGAELYFARPYYVVNRLEGPTTIYDPWPVQPRFLGGIKVAF